MNSRVTLAGAVLVAGGVAQSASTPVSIRQTFLNPEYPAAAGYDEARHLGVSFSAYSATTWSWNGARWVERHPATVPPARSSSAMAWDPNRQSVLMFGGDVTTFITNLRDTWLWSGNDWHLASNSGPSARMAHGLATDPLRRRVVLFGGLDVFGTSLNDTWEWDGARWTRATPATRVPFGRFDFHMAWNSKTRRVAVLGGARYPFTALTLLPAEEWDGRDWVGLSGASGPQPGFVDGSAITDPDGRGVLVFGNWVHSGSSPPPTPVAYLWDGLRLWPQPLGAVPPDIAPTAFLDRLRRKAVAVQCRLSNPRDTMAYSLDQPGWSLATDIPGTIGDPIHMAHVPWLDACLYYIPAGNTMVLGSERGWATVPAEPLYNGAPISTWPLADPARRVLYAYLAQGDGRPETPLWIWSGSSWTRVPSGHRLPPQCIYVGIDPVDDGLLFEQGRSFGKWDVGGPSYVTVAPAPPFASIPTGASAFDPVRRVINTVHGLGGSQIAMLEWDGAAWSTFPAPDPGYSPKCAYLPGLGCVLAGSYGVWVWSGQQWRALPPLPVGSYLRSMQYDSSRHRLRIVMIGIGGENFWDIYIDDLRASTTEPHPGMNVQLTVDSPAHAGQPWLLCFSAETWPGIPLAGLQPEPYRVLPLALDALLLDSLAVGIRGFLDGQGRATAMLRVPNDQSLIGFHCFAAAISIAGHQQLGLVSRPVEINVLP